MIGSIRAIQSANGAEASAESAPPTLEAACTGVSLTTIVACGATVVLGSAPVAVPLSLCAQRSRTFAFVLAFQPSDAKSTPIDCGESCSL